MIPTTDKVWYVIDTPCWPARWKVTYKNCGHNWYFFRDKDEAQRFADKLNVKESDVSHS